MLANTSRSYGGVSKVLHWLIALSIIALIALGWWMVGLEYYDPWYHRAPELHKAAGMLVLFAAALKLIWHRVSTPPALQDDLKPWEKRAARTVHSVLIAAMLLLPITGYLVTTSSGNSVSIFGLFDIPALIDKNDGVRDWAIAVHYYLSYGLIGVIALHAGAALKHQFIDGHATLKRML